MRVAFGNDELEHLYITGEETSLHPYTSKAFFRVMDTLMSAIDERDIRALKSLRMEKLRGNREGKNSVRLNDKYRLIFTIQRDEEGNYILIIEVIDYH